MTNKTINKVVFDSVEFDKENKTMTILNGTNGTYSYKDIKRCIILNEKAKYHGEGVPFTATVASGPLGGGTMWEFSLFVGLKIVMNDDTILAIYTSKNPTHINTDLYLKDRKNAEQIKQFIDKIINKYQNKE